MALEAEESDAVYGAGKSRSCKFVKERETYMSKGLRYIFLMLAMAMLSLGAHGQSVESLRARIRKAEAEIKKTNELLKKTQSDKRVGQQQLKLIQSRITSRREIVSALENQIALIGKQIEAKNGEVNELSAEILALKKEYGAMVYDSYKNQKLNNFLLFLFSAEDFNDATRRLDLMRRYNKARENKADQIRSTSDSISMQIAELGRKQEELNKTKESHAKELDLLGKDESQYRASVDKLRRQESNFANKVKQQQKQIDDAQKKIQEIVNREARKAYGTKSTPAQDKYVAELTGKFDQNKGKLPYPLRGGVITDRYGKHAHHVSQNVTVNNKGVNITGERGAAVTSVFEGSVMHVFQLRAGYNGILIRHGNYITVYANLATISVKEGDKVVLNQKLGNISSETDNNFLHFEIRQWQGANKEPIPLDPSAWLIK